MANKIIVKRGQSSNIANAELSEGELAVAYSADKSTADLYVGTGNGKAKINLKGKDGVNGTNGTNGADGKAATIAIGTVTTGAAGTSAKVENVGTVNAAKLNFTIPRGATGAQGATGATGSAGAKGDKGEKGERGANATLVVASSNSSAKSKAAADYVCDGTSDQTEINNAISALPSGGGKVLLMEGIYNISGSINLNKANVTLEGVGNGTILKRAFNSATNKDGTVKVTGSNCVLSNFAVEESNTSYSNSNNAAVVLNGSQNVTVEDLTIYNGVNGIYLAEADNAIITQNRITNMSYAAIRCDSNNCVVISSNYIRDAEIGILLDWYESGIKVCDNYIIRGDGLASDYTSSQYTIQLANNGYGCKNIDVSDNYILGKNYVSSGGSNNTFSNNKYQ